MNKTALLCNNYVCPFCFYLPERCICDDFPPRTLRYVPASLQEHLRILHQKGYKTTDCGDEECIFLSFEWNHGFGRLIPLPEEFRFERETYTMIYDFPPHLTEAEKNILREDKTEALLRWCEGLRSLR